MLFPKWFLKCNLKWLNTVLLSPDGKLEYLLCQALCKMFYICFIFIPVVVTCDECDFAYFIDEKNRGLA